MLIYSSPQLFAVSHVLRRLLMPRHSPYALLRLNFFPAFAVVLFELYEFLLQNSWFFSREKAALRASSLRFLFHLSVKS